MKKLLGVLALALIGTFLATPVHARHSFRCGSTLIEIGTNVMKVLATCGKPGYIGYTGEDVTRQNKVISSNHRQVWVYDFGPHAFIQTLSIKNGVVTNIKRGGYGYQKK